MGLTKGGAEATKLESLVKFRSTHGPDLYTFEEYFGRMKPNQKEILYICGSSVENLSHIPYVEDARTRGLEVFYMIDPIDEYIFQQGYRFREKEFRNVGKAKWDDGKANDLEKLRVEFKPLTEWAKEFTKDEFSEVKITDRLSSVPCSVVSSAFGWSSNMQRIAKAQATGGKDMMNKFFMSQKPILEVNPFHPIMQSLLQKIRDGLVDEEIKISIRLLFGSQLLRNGFDISDTVSFGKNVEHLVRQKMGVEQEATPVVPEGYQHSNPDEKEEKKEEGEEGQQQVDNEVGEISNENDNAHLDEEQNSTEPKDEGFAEYL